VARTNERHGEATERLRDEDDGRRSSIARTTRSAYSRSPAFSSSPGKSTATTSCAAARKSGTTRLQYHAMPPAPGIKMNELMTGTVACARRRRRGVNTDCAKAHRG
jgi:hypothetical protein